MTCPILPLTAASFTVEVLNSATNDLMRLWRLEARIDTYLSVVSPARTRPQQPHVLCVAPSPPPPPIFSAAVTMAVPTSATETASGLRARGRKAATTKRVKAAKSSGSASSSSTSSLPDAITDTPLSSMSASASSRASPAPSSSDHLQHDVGLVEHDVDLDFDCRVETIERLPTPIATALTLGSTPRGADMDKVKLYGILAASYLATSALYKVVQPCSTVQEYFAQRFRLSRAQLARILHAAQVILDLSATPRDPVDLVPFPLSLDVACAVHKCAGPSRRARRALWSAVLLTSSATGEGDDADLEHQRNEDGDETDTRRQRVITRNDVERAMPLVVQHGIQYYLDAASVDVHSGSLEEQQRLPSSSMTGSPLLGNRAADNVRAADENHPQTSSSGRSVKGVRYRDLELSASSSSSSSPAGGSVRFHPYARRSSSLSSSSVKYDYVTPPDTPATALLHAANSFAPTERHGRSTPLRRYNVPGAAAMDDAEEADHMDVDEDAVEQQQEQQDHAQAEEEVDQADVSNSSIASPPTSPKVGSMPSNTVLFGEPSPSRTRGSSAVSIDLLVAAADFVEQQERRASVSSAATSVHTRSPTAGQFVGVSESARVAIGPHRGPPQYPIEFVVIPFGSEQQPPSIKPTFIDRTASPLSLEFSMAAAKFMMPSPSPSPSPVKCKAGDPSTGQAKSSTPDPGYRFESSLATYSPPRPASSSLLGDITTFSYSRPPSPVPPAVHSSSPQAKTRSMSGGMLEECEASAQA